MGRPILDRRLGILLLALFACLAVLFLVILPPPSITEKLHNRPRISVSWSDSASDPAPPSKESALPPHSIYAPPTPEMQGPSSPYAFVFYATNPGYACSALLLIKRLSILSPGIPSVLMVPPTFDETHLEPFSKFNTTILKLRPPPIAPGGNKYYGSVLLKMMAFQIQDHIPHLQRIIVLDSDQIILKPLHHLFLLPAADVAAPIAYWLPPPQYTTSTLLVVSLSDRLKGEVVQGLTELKKGEYDMDLINKLWYPTRIMTLPGSYCTLNSHWEVRDAPKWMLHPPSIDTSDADAPSATYADPRIKHLRPLNPSPEQETESRKEITQALKTLYEKESLVIHFTAGGKPWSVDMAKLRWQKEKGEVDARFVDMFEEWRQEASNECVNGWELWSWPTR
ncbi:hypothetical protein CC1G_14119 [Coprinopsis cinerea okayama7|uniref:Glycosyltransferase family 8 protein n=1 Tax=Coprinopsis cinerea (strain Okayama-7 / 130 / ATCC MYA-4618 / FGSC 9003) TaxID=240176 RepID=D6RL52_COPC7|nr:hypothetical protein CC1G_14119 [Coprinopsis cinerea okayama7\|eukprot:XP_002911586.1 hypothetical protein CC1G_14119 [Coprinopsis cinerea okayama7\